MAQPSLVPSKMMVTTNPPGDLVKMNFDLSLRVGASTKLCKSPVKLSFVTRHDDNYSRMMN